MVTSQRPFIGIFLEVNLYYKGVVAQYLEFNENMKSLIIPGIKVLLYCMVIMLGF
jgi:hypothetical protein